MKFKGRNFLCTLGFYSFTALFLNVKWHTFERQDCRSGSGLDQVILEGWIQILLTWSGSAALQCERCVNPARECSYDSTGSLFNFAFSLL